MSRFSKSEAEARGWSFFHKTLETHEELGDGITRTKPGSVRAEKYVNLPGRASQLVSEEGETLGKLLERIHAYEQHRDALPDDHQVTPDLEPDPEPQKVVYDHTVQPGENPIKPVDE